MEYIEVLDFIFLRIYGVQNDSPVTGPYSSMYMKLNLPVPSTIYTYHSFSDELSSYYDYNWYKFTATSTGQYNFYTSGTTDTFGELFNNIVAEDSVQGRLDYDSNSGVGNNFKISVYLIQNQTVYIRIKGENYYETGEYDVDVDKISSC